MTTPVCAFGIPSARHPGCLWCAAEVARLCAEFTQAVERGEYDAHGYTPADRRAQARRAQEGAA
jgi:hypothetical protein